MAKIEMDISEYEEMKKNAHLLEKALKREQDLGNKIKALQQEKIEALKQNEKCVTIVKTETRTEHLRPIRSEFEMRRALQDYMSQGNWERASRGLPEIDQLADIFFQRSENRSVPVSETVTVKGLDEYLEEMEQRLSKDAETAVKWKQKDYERIKKKVEALKAENHELRMDIAKYQEDNNELTDEVLVLEDTVEIFEIKVDKLEALNEHLSKDTTIFNFRKMWSIAGDKIRDIYTIEVEDEEV